MNYFKLRKINYKSHREDLLPPLNVDMDDWLYSPYTCLKIRLNIEIANIVVWILQYTSIRPNFITLFYALCGIVGAFLLSSGIKDMIILGVIIFFIYGFLDIVDGFLARLKKQTSQLGHVMDPWAGLVCTYSFLIGFGMYLYNFTQDIHFIYLAILAITINALDFKNYTYHYMMYEFYKNYRSSAGKKKNKKIKKSKKSQNVSSILFLLKNFFQGFLDNRARTIDAIGLIILIELTYDKVILSDLIYYLIIIKSLIVFAGGFYLIAFKGLIEKINFVLKK